MANPKEFKAVALPERMEVKIFIEPPEINTSNVEKVLELKKKFSDLLHKINSELTPLLVEQIGDGYYRGSIVSEKNPEGRKSKETDFPSLNYCVAQIAAITKFPQAVVSVVKNRLSKESSQFNFTVSARCELGDEHTHTYKPEVYAEERPYDPGL